MFKFVVIFFQKKNECSRNIIWQESLEISKRIMVTLEVPKIFSYLYHSHNLYSILTEKSY